MKLFKSKIRKGDNVKVLSGKDKGKTGKVLRVLPELNKVVVENVNMHSKYERSKATRRQASVAQKITFPAAFSISKVMLIDSATGATTRLGYQILDNGTKQRISRKSGKAV